MSLKISVFFCFSFNFDTLKLLPQTGAYFMILGLRPVDVANEKLLKFSNKIITQTSFF